MTVEYANFDAYEHARVVEEGLQLDEDLKGESLSPDSIAYFRELSQLLAKDANEEAEDGEHDIDIITSRAFEEALGHEYRLCVNRQGTAMPSESFPNPFPSPSQHHLRPSSCPVHVVRHHHHHHHLHHFPHPRSNL